MEYNGNLGTCDKCGTRYIVIDDRAICQNCELDTNLVDCGYTQCGRSNCVCCYPYNLADAGPATVFEVEDMDGHHAVQSPKHYALMGDLEAIDVIRKTLTPEQFQGYCLGNFLKYRLRAGEKDALEQDIAKSEVYRNWYNDEEL